MPTIVRDELSTCLEPIKAFLDLFLNQNDVLFR